MDNEVIDLAQARQNKNAVMFPSSKSFPEMGSDPMQDLMNEFNVWEELDRLNETPEASVSSFTHEMNFDSFEDCHAYIEQKMSGINESLVRLQFYAREIENNLPKKNNLI
jgi:hypothetical protein